MLPLPRADGRLKKEICSRGPTDKTHEYREGTTQHGTVNILQFESKNLHINALSTWSFFHPDNSAESLFLFHYLSQIIRKKTPHRNLWRVKETILGYSPVLWFWRWWNGAGEAVLVSWLDGGWWIHSCPSSESIPIPHFELMGVTQDLSNMCQQLYARNLAGADLRSPIDQAIT